MSKSQREKGKRGERRAVKILEYIYPNARRSANQSSGAIQPDVDGTPWWVEAKEGKSPRIKAAFEQAENDREEAGDKRPSLVIAHFTNGPTLAVMHAKRLKEVYIHGGRDITTLILSKLRELVEEYPCECSDDKQCLSCKIVETFSRKEQGE